MAATTYDSERAEAFAGRMLDMLNGGALMVMTSVGHRTGLFDVLAEHGRSTSHELAAAAGLDERYVREWLGAMTAGRIVELEPESGSYSLPAEHAAWLTRAASPDNLAVEAQWIPTLSTVEDDIVALLPRRAAVCPTSVPTVPRGDGRGERADGPLGALRRTSSRSFPEMAERLEEGASLLDLGCGRGRALVLLAERFPRARSSATTSRAMRSRTRPPRRGARARERALRA